MHAISAAENCIVLYGVCQRAFLIETSYLSVTKLVSKVAVVSRFSSLSMYGIHKHVTSAVARHTEHISLST